MGEWKRPVAFILVDGLGAYAGSALAKLNREVDQGNMVRYLVTAAVPTLSYPNYATIISGMDPHDHGLVDNIRRRPLEKPHLFHRLIQAGRAVGLVGYYWWENLAPQALGVHRLYQAEDTEDAWVFEQAKSLASGYHPDFLVIHPMGVDWAGHCYGGDSKEYLSAAAKMDELVADFRAWWKEHRQGSIIVGADHGMGSGRHHDGASEREQMVWYYLDRDCAGGPPIHRQDQVRKLLEDLMEVSP